MARHAATRPPPDRPAEAAILSLRHPHFQESGQPWFCRRATVSAPTRSAGPSGPAGWARSTAPPTPGLFSHYSGKWIPDTKARREAVLLRLRTWTAFSNSSPVEGIETAVRTFYSQDKKISLCIFGDEFTSDSVDDVLRTVERLNRPDRSGQRRVRIHAIGFPTIFSQARYGENTGVRFAHDVLDGGKDEAPEKRRCSPSWARLVAKVYHADPLTCRECGGRLQVVAYIHDHFTIKKILDHLGLSPPEIERPPPDIRQVPVDHEGRELESLVTEEPSAP